MNSYGHLDDLYWLVKAGWAAAPSPKALGPLLRFHLQCAKPSWLPALVPLTTPGSRLAPKLLMCPRSVLAACLALNESTKVFAVSCACEAISCRRIYVDRALLPLACKKKQNALAHPGNGSPDPSEQGLAWWKASSARHKPWRRSLCSGCVAEPALLDRCLLQFLAQSSCGLDQGRASGHPDELLCKPRPGKQLCSTGRVPQQPGQGKQHLEPVLVEESCTSPTSCHLFERAWFTCRPGTTPGKPTQ